MDAKLVERLQLCEKHPSYVQTDRGRFTRQTEPKRSQPCTFTTCYLNFGLIFASRTSLIFFFLKCGHMVVSQHRGAPIWTPKFSNPYYMDPPKKVHLILGNPHIRAAVRMNLQETGFHAVSVHPNCMTPLLPVVLIRGALKIQVYK